ncbi:MAG: NADH-quinone oxidoreductase subunit D [Candidatus Micrarchaeia archaeon]
MSIKINIGPIHPSTHGAVRFVADVEGDTIKGVELHIGFLHRGVEKLLENRTYMQSPAYMEKLDYVAPLPWDDLYVSAVEKAVKHEVKPDAQLARMILLEFQRIASHLIWLGTMCNDLGQMYTMFMWTFRDRAKIIRFMENVAGSRMFYVNLRIGGLAQPLIPTFKNDAYELCDYLEDKIKEYPSVLDSSPVFMERMKNVGILRKHEAIEYGVSGPVLRASGVEYDVRKAFPYYFYDKMKFIVPIGRTGDNYDRYYVRYIEMLQSIKIIRQALDLLPDNPDVVGMPTKLIMPPAAKEVVVEHRELPKGEGIIYMVPDTQKPYRISLRAPSFINFYAVEKIAKNIKFADLFSIFGNFDILIAEMDR